MNTLELDLYEEDGVAWAEQQADALRRRAGGNALDYDNLAEEIEDVGRSITRAARSYIDVIIEHFLKLELVDQPENRRGWRLSVLHARKGLKKELTPTLRARLPAELSEAQADMVELLVAGDVLPTSAALARRAAQPYSWEEITSADWFPEPVGERQTA